MVRVLALETSSRQASLALLEDDQLLVEASLPADERTTQTLLPQIAAALEQVGWKPAQVDLLGVAVGPGSFTGLRIGMTVAKTWAYATGSLLVAVNTLHLLAVQASLEHPQARAIAAAIDAQRGQWFAHVFERAGLLDQHRPKIQVVDPQSWLASLPEDILLTGPALAGQIDTPALPRHHPRAAPSVWHPSAQQLGRLALHGFRDGRADDIWRILPDYGRPSAAQEKKRA